QGFLYVFDRVSGKPVWPIEERPVEKGNVPGEWYAPTQPFPTKPPAYSRNGVSTDDMIDFTPELRAEGLKLASRYKLGPIFTPPALSKVEGPRATLTLGTAQGGTNWPGASYDPETHIVYASACNACLDPLGLVPPPNKEFSDVRYVIGTAGRPVRMTRGPGDPQVTTTATHPRGAMLRAYDKATGKEVGAVYMPAPQSGSPMTYLLNGKQYLVVAVSGGPYSGEYLAFSLPSAAARTSSDRK